jgi:predicted RNase H-like HicB family nuclease
VPNYAVVIHEEPEGGFWAEVPALPGCYSQGETVDEVMENVREAIAGVLEVMKEQGRRPESNIQNLFEAGRAQDPLNSGPRKSESKARPCQSHWARCRS